MISEVRILTNNKRKGKYNANRLAGVGERDWLPAVLRRNHRSPTTAAVLLQTRRLAAGFSAAGAKRGRFDDLPPERERGEEPAMIRQGANARNRYLHGHGEEDLTSGGIRGRFREPEISKFSVGLFIYIYIIK